MPLMRERCDIIVIGLGPGGAGAALEMARHGARVLALDAPGRAKPCGGCISVRWSWLFEWIAQPGPIPRWIAAHPVKRLFLTAPARPTACHETNPPGAWLTDRARLNAWLAERARLAGVRVVHARARQVRPHGRGWRVTCGKHSFEADWLIGADGAGGLLSRRLGLGRPGRVYLGLSQERPLVGGLKRLPRQSAVLDLKSIPFGYGWIFPRGDRVNIGIGHWRKAGKKGASSQLFAALRRFLARNGFAQDGPWRGAAIPCPGRRLPAVHKGRAAVVGDAAAMADPFLGEGIAQAVYTGRLAARAILAGDLGLYAGWLRRGLAREHSHARVMADLCFAPTSQTQPIARVWPGSIELGFCLLRGELKQRDLWAAIMAKALGRPAALDRQARGLYIKQLK